MRHRIKKIPTLSTIKRLLHSDKGTCSRWSINTFRRRLLDGLRSHLFLRPLRAARPSLRPCERDVRRHQEQQKVLTRPADTYFYKDKVVGSNKGIHNSYSGLWFQTIPLSLFAFAFLLVLGMMVCPVGYDDVVMALGEEEDAGIVTQDASDGMNLSLTITSPEVDGTIGTNSDGSVPVVVGEPSFGGVKMNATATGINKTTGYSIYVQTNLGSTSSLVNNIDASNQIAPISDTNGVVGTNIPENQWGYALAKGENLSYAAMTYKPVSASGDTSRPADSGTEELNGDTYTLAFGANIGADKLAGHYTTNVLVSLVAEAKAMVTYNLVYNGNGNTGGSVPTVEPVITRDDSYKFTVADNTGNLVKTNAEFLGWADTADATVAQYTAGSTITLYRPSNDNVDSQVSKTIYAVWKSTGISWDELRYMQDMTPEACASATESTASTGNTYQKQLIDVRDGKTYWVARIGNDCWMTQNLDLDLSTAKPLTPDDSNVTANWTPPEGTQTTVSPSGFIGTNPIKSWDPGYGIRENGTATSLTTATEALAKDTTGQVNAHYLQGNYYTWVAAMAGNTTGNTGNSSICPKGWQLPLSGIANGANPKTFQALTNALGATSGTSTGSSDSKLLITPAYFVRGGRVSITSLSDAGSYGWYWSSVSDNTSFAYNLLFSSTVVGPSDGTGYRYYGISVRCVAQ